MNIFEKDGGLFGTKNALAGRVSQRVKANLTRILTNFPCGISFEKLSNEYKRVYGVPLTLNFTNPCEFIIESEGDDDSGIKSGSSIYSDDLGDELSNLLEKIDISSEVKARSNSVMRKPRQFLEFKYEALSSDTSSSSLDSEKHKTLANFFDTWGDWKQGDVYSVYIANIYDPSKFWVTFVEIDIFQEHLYKFYVSNKNHLMLKLGEISVGLNCVAFIDNLYYRGRVVRTEMDDSGQVKVFLYDFGMTCIFSIDNLYCMHEKFYKIPSLAVRVSLADISTVDHEMWPQKAVNKFLEMAVDRVLVASIVRVNQQHKILEINLADISASRRPTIYINTLLVNENLAKYQWDPPVESDNELRKMYNGVVNHLYLFPTFDEIENGAVPSTVILSEQLKASISWDILYPEYYSFCDE